jgi:hypothetical protein
MTRPREIRWRVLVARIACASVLIAASAGCWSPEPPASGGTFRFAVFGDGPYYAHENGRARRVIDALNARPLEFVIHVGDIMWQRCTDDAYARRRELIERIRHPVVYTPGDNEWVDCVDIGFRPDDPLERLASLRSTFFAPADRSLGEAPLALETQSADPRRAEFVENARWQHGGVSFITIHVVGSGNGARSFPGRSARHDDEVARRTEAAVEWLQDSFRAAADAAAVVVSMHASILPPPPGDERDPVAPIRAALLEEASQFRKPVLVIHGDEHQYIVDRPFRDSATGSPIANVQRLETFGSPHIGWVDVVVDTSLAEPFSFEPSVTPRWRWW